MRRREVCGAGAESARTVCGADEVVVVVAAAAADDDGAAGKFGVGILAVGEERSQWRIAPSKPPESRMG